MTGFALDTVGDSSPSLQRYTHLPISVLGPFLKVGKQAKSSMTVAAKYKNITVPNEKCT